MHMRVLILGEVLRNIEHCNTKEEIVAEITSMRNEAEEQLERETEEMFKKMGGN